MATAQPVHRWWDQMMQGEARAVPILVPDHEGRLTLDEAALRSVLMQPDIRGLPVVVVAAAGAFRRGKSFLLSLLLRFLDAGGDAGWLQDADRPLTNGFAWRSGRQRHTVGIHMWGRPARVRLPGSDQEVAVVLMDAQGAFDDRTTVSENATVFALSALTSSVQIYNMTNNIGSDDLEHLSIFTERGRMACEAYGEAPLQKLLLLVRDWQAPTEIPYGSAGGRELLSEVLDCSAGAREELRTTRRHIEQSFADIDCFLLPHPGKVVATSPAFTGKTGDIDEDFLKSLDELARLVLSPENLVIKRSAGRQLTCSNLVTHFTELFKLLRDGTLPEVRSLVNTMSEANHLSDVSASTAAYTELMAEVCSETSPALPQQQLQQRSQQAEQQALRQFASSKKMLDGDGDTKYKQKLVEAIQQIRDKIFEGNRLKQRLEEARDQLACQKAYSQAQNSFRSEVTRMLNDRDEAFTEEELETQFSRLEKQTMTAFDAHKAQHQRCTHVEQRLKLQGWLREQREEALLFSSILAGQEGRDVQQDRVALETARHRYRSIMEEVQRCGPLPEEKLSENLTHAEQQARQTFQASRGQAHSASSRVDDFLERNIREERDNSKQVNVWSTVIQSVVEVIPTVVNAVVRSGKCTIM